ncbi:MAG: FkbM family methyltransferase [Candidatus Nanoarchaeia archaeon]|nr:FkbM family methyltransferase [Candidatus Nanoarchaeia archaeon]
MAIEQPEINVIEKYIKDGDIVFDVGANIGLWTEQVLNRHQNIKVHAFEPIAEIFKYANDNRVVYNNVCLTVNPVGSKCLWYYPIYPPLSTLYRRSPEVERVNIGGPPPVPKIVLSNSVDSYCMNHNIDKINFLKIDVEGAELDVLFGSIGMISNIDYIQFEYGGCNVDSGVTLEMLYNFCINREFNVFKMNIDELKPILKFSNELEDYQYINFLAINRKLDEKNI